MERLTKKEMLAGHEVNYVSGDDCFCVWSTPKKFMGEAIDRLAAYEDTGLEPEEITTEPYGCAFYCNRKCNLDGDFCAEGPGCPHEVNAETAKHLLELAQAEKDGRLVAYMPGDKVYDRFWTPWIVESSEIHLIGAEIKHLYRCGHPGTDDYYAMYEDEIQTRKEAEAALKKRKDEND